MDQKKLVTTAAALSVAVLLGGLVGCHKNEGNLDASETSGTAMSTPAPAPEPEQAPAPALATATASLQGAPEDTDFQGTVTITPEGAGVKIVADLSGVDKDGPHGFHLHQTGECTHGEGDKHFTSAGGHFNPTNADHACPPTEPRHAGDFGNIEVANGTGHLEITTDSLSLSGDNTVVGKAFILHAKGDDCKTQPTGDAGDRLACGVVTMPNGQ
jgi:superoxide dismutase, Cu-Zn family